MDKLLQKPTCKWLTTLTFDNLVLWGQALKHVPRWETAKFLILATAPSLSLKHVPLFRRRRGHFAFAPQSRSFALGLVVFLLLGRLLFR